MKKCLFPVDIFSAHNTGFILGLYHGNIAIVFLKRERDTYHTLTGMLKSAWDTVKQKALTELSGLFCLHACLISHSSPLHKNHKTHLWVIYFYILAT